MRDTRAMRDTRVRTAEGQLGTSIGAWVALAVALALAAAMAHAETAPQLARIKDVATIEGIRDNQLVGYGLVAGLSGLQIWKVVAGKIVPAAAVANLAPAAA